MSRVLAYVVVALALVTPDAAVRATVRNANDAVGVTASASADSVTVGERFDVTYTLTFADSLTPVTPIQIEPGTCHILDAEWSPSTDANAPGLHGRLTMLPVSIDSVYVPSQTFNFVAPSGDTLRAWSEPIYLALHYLAAESKDLRPLKQQWSMGPNWLLWTLIGAGALAIVAALIWWIRRRRARRPEQAAAPEVRLPPDIVALAELERVEAMGLPAKGEFKTFYTLVTDAVRRYIEARFGVQALDRTTRELLDDLVRRGHPAEGLGALLDEADLVKFAKFAPDAARAGAAIASAREIVVSTTPRVVVGSTPEQQAVN